MVASRPAILDRKGRQHFASFEAKRITGVAIIRRDYPLKNSLPAIVLVAVTALAACAIAPKQPSPSAVTPLPGKSGYYKDDGPGEVMPGATLDAIPDAVPRAEALHRFANRPYVVFGREYVPATSLRPYKERGTASWYGQKFHGEKTSIGDTYDMYAMT